MNALMRFQPVGPLLISCTSLGKSPLRLVASPVKVELRTSFPMEAAGREQPSLGAFEHQILVGGVGSGERGRWVEGGLCGSGTGGRLGLHLSTRAPQPGRSSQLR